MNQVWDERFMAVARDVASWSKDRSTKVGCVVVSPLRDIKATGYNGFPRGIDDQVEERHERPAKYQWTEHAERNAIYAAARLGTSLDGCTMYVPWFPCVDCARAIIQAGIAELVAIEPDSNDPKWGADFKLARQMLLESSVELRYVKEIPSCRS
jgi:dCMP deaminase